MADNHSGSHLDLLRSTKFDPPGSAIVDAIIVPVAYSTDGLDTAIALARKLECPLLALCSQDATAANAVSRATNRGIELVAIDTENIPHHLLPSFETTELLSSTVFAHTRDTSAKRNLGLLLAQLMGWRRIFFLDVDITVPEPGDLCHAAYLLDRYAAVGLTIDEFPDNSVVCHANRATGGDQRIFIGGGALAVNTAATSSSFFPDVYNEDWFFLLDGSGLYPAASTGLAKQDRYNPYSTARAEAEEFGDCLAEGLFWLLDKGDGIQHATSQYWAHFLRLRSSFIDDVIDRLAGAEMSPAERADITTALYAARDRNKLIEPSLCVDYLNAWIADRVRWLGHVNERRGNIPGQFDRIAELLPRLDLMGCSSLTRT